MKKISASMGFIEASECYLELRTLPPVCGSARFVTQRTLHDDRQYIDRLRLFFEDMPLEQIGIGSIAEYQRARLTGEWMVGDELRTFERRWGKEIVQSRCGPGRINQEIGLLKRMLRLARCWDGDIDLYYRKLERQDDEIERALTEEEEERFLRVAASHPRWQVVYWYSLVARHTCFSSDEMRTILQGDIYLVPGAGSLGVNRKHGKNHYRRRRVTLDDGEATWALECLLRRAEDLGCKGPHLYLFPARIGRMYDGTRPIGDTGLRPLFLEVREAAALPWFKTNGWRHTAITRLAEQGVAIPIIQARAGHSNAKMTAHYTHISEAAQRLATQKSQRRPAMPPMMRRGPVAVPFAVAGTVAMA